MPVITDADIEKREKQKQLIQKIEAKKEQHFINEKSHEKKKNEFSSQDLVKILSKKQKFQSDRPKVSLKDIETELKIGELINEKREEQIEKLLQETEMKEIKSEVIGLMALPHTHADKRKIFHTVLHRSDTVNNYVNDNVMFNFFNRANGHMKFGIVYALKYMQTNTIYKQLLHEQQQALQQVGKPPQPEPVPEPEPENES
jgi:hypothetical protein